MIRMSCPGCARTLQLPDNLAGRRVACPSCGEKITAPAADVPAAPAAVRARPADADRHNSEFREERRPRPAGESADRSPFDRDDEERRRPRRDYDDDLPRRRRKRKKDSSSLALWIGLPVGLVFVIAAVIIIVVVVKNRPANDAGPVAGGGPAPVFGGGGAASVNKGKIEGTRWTNQACNVGREFLPAGVMDMDFNADGTLTWRIAGKLITGRYTLEAGTSVLFSDLSEPISGMRTHRETIVITGDNLTLSDPTGTIPFTRRR